MRNEVFQRACVARAVCKTFLCACSEHIDRTGYLYPLLSSLLATGPFPNNGEPWILLLINDTASHSSGPRRSRMITGAQKPNTVERTPRTLTQDGADPTPHTRAPRVAQFATNSL